MGQNVREQRRLGNSVEFDKRWRKGRAAAKRARLARRKQRGKR